MDIFGPEQHDTRLKVPGLDRGIVCAQCGKIFYTMRMEAWVYKNDYNGQLRYFHTWSCMREWEKKHLPKPVIDEGLY